MLVGSDPSQQSLAIGGFVNHRSTKPPIPLARRPIAGLCRPGRTGVDRMLRAMAASAQYSVTVRVELDARQEPLGKLTAQIAEAGGALQSVDLVPGAGREGKRVREFTIDANSPEHWEQILRSIGSTRGAKVLGFTDRTFEMHKKGKIEQHNKYPLKTRDDLSMAYTPGVARVCEYIAEDKLQGVRLHDQGEHGRGRLRRLRRARSRRHRPRGGDAGDGGQGDAVQGVRPGRRLPDLPRDQRPRGDHPDA